MQDILIVEGDSDVRSTLSDALTNQGYSVASTGDGRAALDTLDRSKTPPRVIVLDLMMPAMEGWRVRQELLAEPQWARVPLILLSGAGGVQPQGAVGRVHYLSKPVSLGALLGSIARHF